jgi:hypothetical protein
LEKVVSLRGESQEVTRAFLGGKLLCEGHELAAVTFSFVALGNIEAGEFCRFLPRIKMHGHATGEVAVYFQ